MGENAVRLSLRGSGAVWWDYKRKIGNDFAAIFDSTRYNAQDIITPLLRALREDAEVFLGRFVSSCVLAVPENFSSLEREIVTQAAEAAAMTNVRIISEPEAVALAFGREGRFLILDFGAYCSDISVVESEDGVCQVLESVESSNISGWNFDLVLAEWLRERLMLERMPEEDPRWRALILEAEAIKIALSTCLVYDWKPPSMNNREFPPLSIEREELERMTRFSIRRLTNMAGRLWEKHNPERLLLAGGSSRTPLLREILEREIAGPGRLSFCTEESTAAGAALYAAAWGDRQSPDAPGNYDTANPSTAGQRVRDLKMRLVFIEPSLTAAQQKRLHLMFNKLENFEDDAVSIEILEGVVKNLEATLARK